MKERYPLKMAMFALAGAACASVGEIQVSNAQTGGIAEAVNAGVVAPELQLTTAERTAIYLAARRDKGKAAPARFATQVGADVPPMIELYILPEDILASYPVTKLYQFTQVDDRVVLVDPTRMRVAAVIGPNSVD